MPTDSSQPTTPSGLPVRMPQASIAPPLRTDVPDAPRPETAGERRPPEEIHRLVDELRDGTRRGRAAANAQYLPPADLNRLLDDLVKRLKEAAHAIVLSAGGLIMAASEDIDHEDAEYLSAVASGIQSLAKGVGERFEGGPIRQTIVEMRSAYLLVTVAGNGACLAVLSTEDADIGLIAREMAMLVPGLATI